VGPGYAVVSAVWCLLAADGLLLQVKLRARVARWRGETVRLGEGVRVPLCAVLCSSFWVPAERSLQLFFPPAWSSSYRLLNHPRARAA